jgi:hypothetical protein
VPEPSSSTPSVVESGNGRGIVSDDLTPAQRASLDALPTSRGPCPTAATGAAGAAGATRWLRWALPLAAAAVLGVALTLIDRLAVLAPGRAAVEPDTIRGTEIQLMTPAGALEVLREFSWQSPITADRYRVTVRRGTTVVWQTETGAQRVAPPVSGTIERDVQYEWQVEALDREGNVRMTSPPQSFVVY